MGFMRRLYKRVDEILPNFYKEHIRKNMIYAGIVMNYKEWIGFFFIYSIAVGITIDVVLFIYEYSLGYGFTEHFPWYLYLGLVVGTFLIFQFASELLLALAKRSRTLFIEKILPDVLSLVSSNMKSGMTIDQALLLSTRDEFGMFKKDLVKASKETLAGKNLGEALREISNTIDSKIFSRTVDLIVEGINGGGELSFLLDNIASDIRTMNLLRREAKAGIAMYTLILILASGFGAPMLFGVSLYEVETLSKMAAVMPSNEAIPQVGFIKFSIGEVDIGFLRAVSIASIVINSIFGALMFGVLNTGSAKDGVKLIPLMIAISLAIFFVSNYIVSNTFVSVSALG